MRGASAGKTMYVIPYLMAPPGNALAPWAAGVQLTDHRTVVLHMIRMSRVGSQYVENLEDPNMFVRAVHVTGDLENLGQGTPDDQRYFVTVADERTILHFGSSYGGNALLGKIAHGLRQGGLRRLGVAEVPRRAVHADRHRTTSRPARPTTSAVASRAPRARPTWR